MTISKLTITSRNIFLLSCILFFAALFIYLLRAPFWDAALSRDQSYFIYAGKKMIDGVAPHLSGFELRMQLVAFISSTAVLVSRIIGVHVGIVMQWYTLILYAVQMVLLFWLAMAVSRGNKLFSILTFLLALTSQPSLAGMQPKLLAATLGIATLLCVFHKKHFWAGVCSSLAFLAIQTGGVYIATVYLGLIVLKRPWRDFLYAVAGSALGISWYVGYFLYHHAFMEMFEQTVTYILLYHEHVQKITDLPLAGRATKLYSQLYTVHPLMTSAFLGWLVTIPAIAAMYWVTNKKQAAAILNQRTLWVLAIPACVYFVFNFIDYQGVADHVNVYPYYYLTGAMFIYLISTRVLLPTLNSNQQLIFLTIALIMFNMLLAISIQGNKILAKKTAYLGNRDNNNVVLRVKKDIAERNYTIASIMTADFLIYLDMPDNHTYWTVWGLGVENWMAATQPDGLQTIINEFEEKQPDIVVLQQARRIRAPFLKNDFIAYIESKYTHRFTFVDTYDIYYRNL